MKHNMNKSTAIILAGFLAAGSLAGCGQKPLDGTKTVATINGTQIPMGVVSLYARRTQAQTEAMYRSFLGSGYSIWSTQMDEETGETYGDQAVQNSLEAVEIMYLLKEKAADYGVEVTDDDKAAIQAAAKSFMEENTEETLKELSVTQDQVETLLELQTYENRMYDPVVADADTTVDETEAQQASFSYVSFTSEEPEAEEEEETDEEASEEEEAADDTAEAVEEAADDAAEAVEEAADDAAEAVEEAADDAAEAVEEAAADDAAEAVEEAADDAAEAVEEAADDAAEAVEEVVDDAAEAVEEVADDAAEAVEEAADDAEETAQEEEKPAMSQAEKAQAILDLVKADPEADMGDLAKEIDDTLYDSVGSFTFNETENEYLSNTYADEVVEALRTLKDGEVYDGVVEANDRYYILRMDKVNDEEETAETIEQVQDSMRSDFYDETTQKWLEESDLKVDEKVLKTLTITDYHTFTLVEEEEEETEEVEETEETEETEEAVEETTETAQEESTEAESETAAEETSSEETTQETEKTTEADTVLETVDPLADDMVSE